MEYSSCWRVRSWDRFINPRTFQKVRVIIGKPHDVRSTSTREEFENERLRLQKAMMSLVERRNRSFANSSRVDVDLTSCGCPIMTRTFENGRGMINRSQLLTRQQLEYSMLIGTTGAPVFSARKIMPGPSS